MAASPRYSPLRHHHPPPRSPLPLLRLLKYVAAAAVVYLIGYRHGASQTPTVPALGGLRDGGSSSGSRLRSQPPPQSAPPREQEEEEEEEEAQQQRGWAGSVGDIRPVPANHAVDDRGRFIAKQVMIPPGTIPAITGFTRAVLKPTQIVQRHSHATMHEVFYVESGKGVFMVDDMPHVVGDGSFVHLPPGEAHAVLNSASDAENGADLVLLYFGVAVDER